MIHTPTNFSNAPAPKKLAIKGTDFFLSAALGHGGLDSSQNSLAGFILKIGKLPHILELHQCLLSDPALKKKHLTGSQDSSLLLFIHRQRRRKVFFMPLMRRSNGSGWKEWNIVFISAGGGKKETGPDRK